MTSKKDADRIHDDAKPQFVRTRKGASNSGVSSAEPRVITGDEDATFTNHPERDRPGPNPASKSKDSGKGG